MQNSFCLHLNVYLQYVESGNNHDKNPFTFFIRKV